MTNDVDPAEFLFGPLSAHAAAAGLDTGARTTPYVNTIPVSAHLAHPGDVELEPRLLAMVQARLSSPDGARVAVLVVPTNEELAIARHAMGLIASTGI